MSKIDLELIDQIESLLIGKPIEEKNRVRQWITVYKATHYASNKKEKNNGLNLSDLSEEKTKCRNYTSLLQYYLKCKDIEDSIKAHKGIEYFV